jgi:hypothetical protein
MNALFQWTRRVDTAPGRCHTLSAPSAKAAGLAGVKQ